MGLGFGAIEKKVERVKYLAYVNRLPAKSSVTIKGRDFERDLETLRRDGTLVLENFISPEVLKSIKSDIESVIEEKCDFEFPCLAQTKVDKEKHKEIITKNFKFSNENLHQRGVCFAKDEVLNYNQMLRDFKPTTLKISVRDSFEHYNLWLNPYLLRLVEEYMGRVPFLTEAYVRRNFPSEYKVMNHNWHRDMNHEHHLLKAFLFFTDCDIQHGPHEFVMGSHNDLTLSGKDYFEESEVDALYPPQSEYRFISRVKAGTVVLEDTRGLHRASVPKEDFRDLGFAIFVPAPFWRPHKHPFYKISNAVYDKLSTDQKKYIPKCSLASKNSLS